MSKDSNEVFEAVDKINDEIIAADADGAPDNLCVLEYSSTGFTEAVSFGATGYCLWSSEGEGMPYTEDGEERVPFQPYLRDLLMKHLAEVKRLHDALAKPPIVAVDTQ